MGKASPFDRRTSLDRLNLSHESVEVATGNSSISDSLANVRRRSTSAAKWTERLVLIGLMFASLIAVVVTTAIVVILTSESAKFFAMGEVSVADFLFGTEWSPMLGSKHRYGIWPLLNGTLYVATIAMLVALPLGLITAIYLSEYASPTTRAFLKPALEVLAGIPTVVYGLFAIILITPSLRWITDPFLGSHGFQGQNVLAAGIAVGILCLPIVSSLCEDALRAVPRALREGAYGLGGTKFDVTVRVVVPAALSGVIAAFLLAAARAIGETMVVAMAAGSTAQLSLDPREPIQTMTGYIAQMAKGDPARQSPEYLTLYAVGATLFVLTLILTLIGQWIRKRFRETYD